MELRPDSRATPGRRDSGICPKCGSGYAQRSHRKGWIEHLAASLALYPYRCWDSNYRFYLHLGQGTSNHAQTKRPSARGNPMRRNWRAIVFYGSAVLLLLGFLYYITRKAPQWPALSVTWGRFLATTAHTLSDLSGGLQTRSGKRRHAAIK